MSKSQVNFRASKRTVAQLSDLQNWHGESQTEIVARAIDDLWRREDRRINPLACPVCKDAYRYYEGFGWIANCDCLEEE